MNEVSQLAVMAKDDATLMEALWLTVERLILFWVNRYYPKAGTRLYDADDLIQAGFLAVCDAVQTYDPAQGMEFTSYLRFAVSTHFRAVMGTRGAKQRPEVSAMSLDELISAEDGDGSRLELLPDPTAELAYTRAVEDIAAAQDVAQLMPIIDRLPDDQRRALMLTGYKGITCGEAAEAVGCSPARLQTLRNRAKRAVRYSKPGRRIARERLIYRHVTLAEWKRTGTSSVEWAVMGW